MINLISLMNKDKPPVLPRYKKWQEVSFLLKGTSVLWEVINYYCNGYNILSNNYIFKALAGDCKLIDKKEISEYNKLLKEYNLYCAKLNLIKAQEEYDRILNS